jgi:hypothetical protein
LLYRDARSRGRSADAEATVRGILENDPEHFRRAIPFIGYVQILHESSYHGGQRFRRIEVHLSWCVPGPVRPPADRNQRWRLRAACRVDDDGRLHVPAGATIRSLDLRGAEVTDGGLSAVAGLHGLRRLDLSGTAVSDRALAHVRDLRLLRSLDLSGTAVTDRGLGSLAALPVLRELRLRGTAVTDRGLEAIAFLPGLQLLDVRETEVTEKGIESVRWRIGRTERRSLRVLR